jgi:hypothetical protein
MQVFSFGVLSWALCWEEIKNNMYLEILVKTMFTVGNGALFTALTGLTIADWRYLVFFLPCNMAILLLFQVKPYKWK